MISDKENENEIKNLVKHYIINGERDACYKEIVSISDHLRFHIDGFDSREKPQNPFFEKLIDQKRPGEDPEVKIYRRENYSNRTKEVCFKALNSIKKIVRSEEWIIDYSNSLTPSIIKEGEQLEDYCESNFPYFKSIENWGYSYAMDQFFKDPNALIVTIPIEFDIKPNEFRKPYSYIIPSKNRYHFSDNNIAIVKSDKVVDYYSDDGKTKYKSPVYWLLNQNEIWEITVKNESQDYDIKLKLTHNIGELPVFEAASVFKKTIDNNRIFDSFLSPMLPALDDAAQEGSDLKAAVTISLHPTPWHYQGGNCKTCFGEGKIRKAGNEIICSECGGNGAPPSSPFKTHIIKRPGIDEQPLSPPFGGFIEKDKSSIELQMKRVDAHNYAALASINMEFLAENPLNQSGIAKEIDKDELNNFVYTIAYHLIESVLKKVYYFTNEYRYIDIITDKQERMKMLPEIPIPEHFDLLNDNVIADQVSKARTAKFDPFIINELEIDYVCKKFGNQPQIREKIKTAKQIDPFPGYTTAEKTEMLFAGNISKQDYMLSVYINNFINKAIHENKDFLKWSYLKKVQKLKEYTSEVIASTSAEEQAKKIMNTNEETNV